MFTFAVTVGGLLGTTALGYAQEYFNVTENIHQYGYTLAGALIIAYLTSIPLFLKAGDNYK